MTRDEVLAIVNRWQIALQGRDAVTYLSLYADNVELQSPLAGTVSGHEALVKAFNAFFTAFPDASFVSEPPIIDGNRVAIVSVVSGTDTGGLMGLPPSGHPFRFRIVFLLELAGGKIVRDCRNYDFTGLLIQLGVLKAKPA
jgi:steroid delta-isomerase-like uncharacterized protein